MIKKALSQKVSFACSIYQTPAGFGAVLASASGLVAHLLPYGAGCEGIARERVQELCRCGKENDLTKKAAQRLGEYFRGQAVPLDLPLDLSGFTAFRQGVYRVVAAIPYGQVMSYAAVAAACGSPQAARAVGGAMAANALPIFIPCHRVVGAGGIMTGFTAPGGVDSKRELLALEGAYFDKKGCFCRGL